MARRGPPVLSVGNGPAMRASPVGLRHRGDPPRICRESLLQWGVAHRDAVAIGVAAGQADAAPCFLKMPASAFTSVEDLLVAVGDGPDDAWPGLDGGADQTGPSEGRSRARERTE